MPSAPECRLLSELHDDGGDAWQAAWLWQGQGGRQGELFYLPAAIRPIRRSPGSCFLPDLEGAQSFWPLGLHDDVRHHGKARTALRPVQQVLYVLAGPLEDGLHPAIVEVAYPPAHPMQHGHPLARIPEVDALNPARDQHPETDHSKTLRPRPF